MRCKLAVPRWGHRAWPENVTSGSKPALKVQSSFFRDSFLENYENSYCRWLQKKRYFPVESFTKEFTEVPSLEFNLSNGFVKNDVYICVCTCVCVCVCVVWNIVVTLLAIPRQKREMRYSKSYRRLFRSVRTRARSIKCAWNRDACWMCPIM